MFKIVSVQPAVWHGLPRGKIFFSGLCVASHRGQKFPGCSAARTDSVLTNSVRLQGPKVRHMTKSVMLSSSRKKMVGTEMVSMIKPKWDYMK